MVELEEKLTNVNPEERIKILQRLKELEEEKIKKIEKQKKEELNEIKNKSKNLEKELDEQIKDSVGDLTSNIEHEEINSKKKMDFLEKRLQELNNNPKPIKYSSIISEIKSNKEEELRNAYNELKEILYSQNSGNTDKMFDYTALKKIKSTVDSMNNMDSIADPTMRVGDDHQYKQRMKSILDQAFDNIAKYE